MPKITEMYAFVCADKDENDEGIIGALMPNGMWVPLVGADPARAESLRPIAQKIATIGGKPVRLMRFTGASVMQVIEP